MNLQNVDPANAEVNQAAPSPLGRRDIILTLTGILLGVILLTTVWASTTNGSRSVEVGVGETHQPAPHFALPGLDGTTIQLSDYRGKVVLVNFWGTWCEPCKEETPALQAAYERLRGQGLVIIGVDLFNGERLQGRDTDGVREFVEQYGVTYPIALDTTGEVAADYSVAPIPVSFMVDRAGTIRFIRVGQLTAANVEQLFHRLETAGNTKSSS